MTIIKSIKFPGGIEFSVDDKFISIKTITKEIHSRLSLDYWVELRNFVDSVIKEEKDG